MRTLSVIGLAAAVGGLGVLVFQAVATPAPAATPGSAIAADTVKVASLADDEARFQATLETFDTKLYSISPSERDPRKAVAPAPRIQTDRMTVRQMPTQVGSLDKTHVAQQVAWMDPPSSSSHPTQVGSLDMPNATQQVAGVQRVLDRLQ